MKTNCWDLKSCERHNGGAKVSQLGVCPAASDRTHHGKNGGQNGGRHCWKIADTFCGGKVQGTYADKLMSCVACEIYKQIRVEEGAAFSM